MNTIKSKKAQGMSKTVVLATIILIYACIITFFGLANITPTYQDCSSGICQTVQNSGFFQNIIFTITELGWFNAIFFTPLLLVLGWVILSSAPTVNGGA